VTQTVAATPVVGPATAPVVHAVTETAQQVVAPVTAALTNSPVSQLTDPILDAVAGVPVVGDLVTDLGVITAVDDVVGVVDDTTALLGGVTDATVPPVLEALDPTTPDPEPGSGGVAEPPVPVTAAVAAGVTHASAIPPQSASSSTSGHTLSVALSAADGSAATGDDSTTAPAGAPPGSLPGTPVPASSSAGSGAGAGAAHARLSDVDSSPLRAGERTSGASDDVLPSSPVADTDVSPD
jgi:hypothetical protein